MPRSAPEANAELFECACADIKTLGVCAPGRGGGGAGGGVEGARGPRGSEGKRRR